MITYNNRLIMVLFCEIMWFEFLDKVNPKYAIISVGTGNVYDHPKDITLNKLKGIEVHRTDKEGTIRVISDGKNIDIETFKTNTNG